VGVTGAGLEQFQQNHLREFLAERATNPLQAVAASHEDQLTRERLNRIAADIFDMQTSLAGEELRRVLRSCASQLKAAAHALPSEGKLDPVFEPPVVMASRGLAESLGIAHRSAARLLALLLVEPGTVLSCKRLAASMGVSAQSVKVFAHHLRHWLAAKGFGESLKCRWGVGYLISPADADCILMRTPCLETLVALTRDEEREQVQTWARPRLPQSLASQVARADPFPVVHHRRPEPRPSA